MTFIRDLKKQSWSWRFLLLIGFLVFGTYLAFDVLDLDGSNLPSDLSRNTIATLESSQTEAERLFRLDYSTLATSGQVCLIRIPQVVADPQPSVIRALTRIHAVHHQQILARMHVTPEATSSSSAAADPA